MHQSVMRPEGTAVVIEDDMAGPGERGRVFTSWVNNM